MRAKNDTADGYKELHHIFCKSFSKALNEKIDDSAANLVQLLFKNHCKAHWLLYKCTVGEQKQAMATAFLSMISFKSSKTVLELGLTAADYQELQEYVTSIKMDPTLNYWTPEEEQFLLKNYPISGQRYCAEALNKSLTAISAKANVLGIAMDKWWTEAEIKWLVENYAILGARACSQHLNRTYGSIVTKASELELTKDQTYSEQDKLFIVDNYPKYGAAYCANRLGKTKEAIKAYANKTLKLKCLPQGTPIYCPELDQYFSSISQAAVELNMSDGNICSVINGRLESTKGLHFIKVNKEEYYAERTN